MRDLYFEFGLPQFVPRYFFGDLLDLPEQAARLFFCFLQAGFIFVDGFFGLRGLFFQTDFFSPRFEYFLFQACYRFFAVADLFDACEPTLFAVGYAPAQVFQLLVEAPDF